jgi:TRAP-type C4-dicarboxylate transport system permease small subunit
MQEPMGLPADPPAARGVERALLTSAKGFALVGGGLFIGLIAMSLVSIIGRKLANAPITGDVELMQVGTAVAAAAFLPLCTTLGEHLRVDFFTEFAPVAARRVLDAVSDLLLGLVALLLAWRAGLQTLDIREAAEVTPLLSIPIWLPMAGMIPSLVLVALCALARGWRDLSVGAGVAFSRHTTEARS